jgi:hypothetical protein
MIPGWSMVAAEKNIVEPSARSIAAAMPPMVGYAMFEVPVYIATELGPCRSTTSARRSATSATSWSLAMRSCEPSGRRFKLCSSRSGLEWISGRARPFGHV